MATQQIKGADLTPKQQEVFDLLRTGMKVGEVARSLGVKPNVVYSHVARLKSKGLVDTDGNVVTANAETPVADLSGVSANGGTPSATLGEAIREEIERLAALRAQVNVEADAHTTAIDDLMRQIEGHRAAIAELESQAKVLGAALEPLTVGVPEPVGTKAGAEPGE